LRHPGAGLSVDLPSFGREADGQVRLDMKAPSDRLKQLAGDFPCAAAITLSLGRGSPARRGSPPRCTLGAGRSSRCGHETDMITALCDTACGAGRTVSEVTPQRM